MAKSKIQKSVRICKVKGCGLEHHGKGYCSRHCAQISTRGRILERTVFDRNEFIIVGNDCFIQLYDKYCNPTVMTVIDANDIQIVKDFKWASRSDGYVTCKSKGKRLARVIMYPVPDGMEVDHRDRNPLNNRRNNLRYATSSQNKFNSVRKNTRGFKGVFWDKSREKWQSKINYKCKSYYIGRFISKEDAARAYNEKALELHGEFAVLNDV